MRFHVPPTRKTTIKAVHLKRARKPKRSMDFLELLIRKMKRIKHFVLIYSVCALIVLFRYDIGGLHATLFNLNDGKSCNYIISGNFEWLRVSNQKLGLLNGVIYEFGDKSSSKLMSDVVREENELMKEGEKIRKRFIKVMIEQWMLICEMNGMLKLLDG